MKRPPQEVADLVVTGGLIHTMDAHRRIHHAMAIKEGRIVFTGSEADAEGWIGSDKQVLDLEGRLVLPSFVDAHCHLTSGVCEVFEPELHGVNSLQGYQQVIRDFLAGHPAAGAVQAGGWVNAIFDEHGPRREALDEVSRTIPILLYSEDYHNAWVNSKALDLAGITASTPDPPNGIIERDPVGHPSGTLREAAVDLAKEAVPAYTTSQVQSGLEYFQKKAHSLGITAVYNPLVSAKDLTDLEALHQWEISGSMRLRVPSALEVEPKDPLSFVDELVAIRDAHKAGRFKIVAVKMFMDGVLEGGTAYLEEPYLHLGGSRGLVNWEPDRFNAMCAAVDRAGFQIHVHSIGDAATRLTLDGFATARVKNGKRDARHSITHLQLVNDRDFDRFASLEVVAVVQPFWFLVDANYLQALRYIGPERAARQYPMAEFLRRGVVVAGASDYNVTLDPDPLVAIEMGVRRMVPNDFPGVAGAMVGQVLWPDEKVTVEDMVSAFTISAAQAAFLDDEIGSLEAGKKGDFIILDENIFEVDPSGIHTARVLGTFFEGREVFRHPASSLERLKYLESE